MYDVNSKQPGYPYTIYKEDVIYIPMYIHHLTSLRVYVALQNLKFYSVTKERDFLTYMEDPCRR